MRRPVSAGRTTPRPRPSRPLLSPLTAINPNIKPIVQDFLPGLSHSVSYLSYLNSLLRPSSFVCQSRSFAFARPGPLVGVDRTTVVMLLRVRVAVMGGQCRCSMGVSASAWRGWWTATMFQVSVAPPELFPREAVSVKSVSATSKPSPSLI